MTDSWPIDSRATQSERLAAARNLDLPLPETATHADRMRRRLFEGEKLNTIDVRDEYGVSHPFLAQQISTMKKFGYEFEREMEKRGDDNASTYRLLNPEHKPPEKVERKPRSLLQDATNRRARERKREQRAKAKTTSAIEPATNGHAPLLPTLGDQVQVSFLAIGNDGEVRVGIRRGEQSWLLKLEGATE